MSVVWITVTPKKRHENLCRLLVTKNSLKMTQPNTDSLCCLDKTNKTRFCESNDECSRDKKSIYVCMHEESGYFATGFFCQILPHHGSVYYQRFFATQAAYDDLPQSFGSRRICGAWRKILWLKILWRKVLWRKALQLCVRQLTLNEFAFLGQAANNMNLHLI